MLLVVAGHALGGLIDSPLGAANMAFRNAFFVIYSFHMPLFFMLSGVLVARRIEANPTSFRGSLWSNIAYPYFLWSVIQYSLIYALGSLVNTPVDRYWSMIGSLPWHSVSQFWFLHALFQLHLLAWLGWRRLGPAAFLLVCLAVKPLTALLPMPDMIRLAANQAPYYGLGVVLGTAGLTAAFVARPAWLRLALLPLAAALIIAALAVAPGLRPDIDFASAKAAALARVSWQEAVLPAAFAGTGATIALASLCAGRIGAALAFIGQRSMAIFILHVMAVAGTRIGCARVLHINDASAVLGLTIVAGVVAPLIAYALLDRLGLAKRLGLG